MTVVARGTTGEEILQIGDQTMTLFTMPSPIQVGFDWAAPEIHFVNDLRTADGRDRNAIVESVSINGLDIPLDHRSILSTAHFVDDGQGCGAMRFGVGGLMHCNG